MDAIIIILVTQQVVNRIGYMINHPLNLTWSRWKNYMLHISSRMNMVSHYL
jgi:hypothetical protein